MKIQKKFVFFCLFFFFWGEGSGWGVAFVKIQKKMGGGGLGQGGGRVGGNQGGWEQRSEACVKIQKKLGGGVEKKTKKKKKKEKKKCVRSGI